MSPQLNAQVDEKHFEIVGPTFSNTVREFRRLLYRVGCKCERFSRLILKNCLYSMESDSGCRNQASLRRNTPLGKRPTELYCACAPAYIVPSMPGQLLFLVSWLFWQGWGVEKH